MEAVNSDEFNVYPRNPLYICIPATNYLNLSAFVIGNNIYLVTKQAALMRRSTVLSLPFSLSVPWPILYNLCFCSYTVRWPALVRYFFQIWLHGIMFFLSKT